MFHKITTGYLIADRGVARSKNVAWTTDLASKWGLEAEPSAGSRGPDLGDQIP